MQKIILSSLLAVLLVPANQVFAQKNPLKSVKTLANLERAVTQPRLFNHVIKVQVPSSVVKSGRIPLFPADIPRRLTPVNASLAARAGAEASVVRMYVMGLEFVMSKQSELGYGKAFYTDADELAQDLNVFYKGKADTYTDSAGHTVKLYALPVDGILYQPDGQQEVQVLNSQEYFVVYDETDRTGKIVPYTPQSYNLYVYEEIWKNMGTPKLFDDLNNLCDSILMAHLHKARLDQTHVYGQFPALKTWVKQNKVSVYNQLNTADELLPYLKTLPKVREQGTQFMAYVVELPVEGLVWVDRGGTKHVYNPKDHVMLFFELGSVGIFPRADVENPKLFVPVQKPALQQKPAPRFMAHPQSSQWTLYESEKKAWNRDRQQHVFEGLWAYYPHYFDSQEELGRILRSFHRHEILRVYDKNTRRTGFVYEIPVEGLTLGHNTTTIDPETYVFIYDQETGGQLVKRADLENAVLYEFVK